MSSSLDMSLDDIIKTNKAGRTRNNTRGRGNRGSGSGPTRTTRSSTRDSKPYQANQQNRAAAPSAPLHTSVIRQSAPDGSKMQVSNLDHRVTSEDLKLIFSSRVGPLKKCTLMYDQNGKSTGSAHIHFNRVGDAAVAYGKFNNVPLDGRPMKIEIVLAPAAAQAVLPAAAAPASRAPANNHSNQQQRGNARGGRGGRGQGTQGTQGRQGGQGGQGGQGRQGAQGGRRGGREKKETKTADQLDAEMNDYMQVDA